MAQLAEAIQYVNAAEIAKNENALVASLSGLQDELGAWYLAHTGGAEVSATSLQPFIEFCHSKGVPHLPARPSTLAAYVLEQAALGKQPDKVRELVTAIEVLHDLNGHANPAATSLVRFALDRMAPIEPPRSWAKEEKLLFTALPPEIQYVVHKRERSREKELRNRQNALAEEMKKVRQSDSAETKPVIIEEEKVI